MGGFCSKQKPKKEGGELDSPKAPADSTADNPPVPPPSPPLPSPISLGLQPGSVATEGQGDGTYGYENYKVATAQG